MRLSKLLESRIALLGTESKSPLLKQGLRGIERETLRVDERGRLANTPHPPAWGSALTHPHITTDYAETLVEFITPACHDVSEVLRELDNSHRFAYSKLSKELLWTHSMPCDLPPESEIEIAWYGKSNIGMLKHVYRRGLALRYGKPMQCISGIHYNFSLSEELWVSLQAHEAQQFPEQANLSAKNYRSERYLAMIRNFRRYSWLLMYLFGASPALSSCFLKGRKHQLESLSADTLYLPYATSLRMSDLGYQNDAQTDLHPRENSLDCYVETLSAAVNRAWPAYEALGMQRDGEWIQISANVLQIENEYYSTIRPKRIVRTGERPIQALCRRGVQYVEVRCMDVDPFEPVGITEETARFLDAFLLFCALEESGEIYEEGNTENAENFARVVKEGRRPNLMLFQEGKEISMLDWGRNLLDRIAPLADLLDAQRGDQVHRQTLATQAAKLENPDLTPSAKVLAAIRANGGSFNRFGLLQSALHATHFRSRPPEPELAQSYQEMAKTSLADQAAIEAADTLSFDEYITAYRASTLCNACDEE